MRCLCRYVLELLYQIFEIRSRLWIIYDLKIARKYINVLQGMRSRNACCVFLNAKDILVSSLYLYNIILYFQAWMVQI